MPRIAPAEPPYEPAGRRRTRAHHAARRAAVGPVPHHGPKPARLRQDVRRRPSGQRPAQPAPARDRDRSHDGPAGLRVRMGRPHRLVRRAGRLRAEQVAATVAGAGDAACWTRRGAGADRPGRRSGRPAHDRRRRHGRRSRRTSTRRRSSRRSPWSATTTRSASSASDSSCRSKATPPLPRLRRRCDLVDPSDDAVPAGAHGAVGEVVLRRAEAGMDHAQPRAPCLPAAASR